MHQHQEGIVEPVAVERVQMPMVGMLQGQLPVTVVLGAAVTELPVGPIMGMEIQRLV